MRKHKYLSLLIIACFVVPLVTNAASFSSLIKRPLGGKVIRSGQSAEIACTAMSGPIFMNPFNIATPGPFFIRTTTNGPVSRNRYLLGNYSLVPDIGTCYNPETGAPIPAFEIKPYGVSR